MNTADLIDTNHILRLAPDSQKYCEITPFYGSPTYFYMRLGMGLSVSSAIRQQIINKVFKTIPNRERYKIIMDNAMVFSRKEHLFGDFTNIFKTLIKFG